MLLGPAVGPERWRAAGSRVSHQTVTRFPAARARGVLTVPRAGMGEWSEVADDGRSRRNHPAAANAMRSAATRIHLTIVRFPARFPDRRQLNRRKEILVAETGGHFHNYHRPGVPSTPPDRLPGRGFFQGPE